jgi:hypothetical protein
MEASYFKHVLKFKSPSGTSRGVLKTKDSWFIVIKIKIELALENVV